MKKHFIWAFAAASVFFSCNEDDELKFEQVDRMAGEWTLTHIGSLNATNNLNYVAVVSSCATTLSFSENSFVENNAELIGESCETSTRSGEYEIENGNLVRHYGDATTATDDIFSLSHNQLELVHRDPETSALTFLRFKKEEMSIED